MSHRGPKTKIVCTIGPASRGRETPTAMIEAGMNVARLNFVHGTLEKHAATTGAIRAAAQASGRRVAILADLPGPKLRIGRLAEQPVELKRGHEFTLAVGDFAGDAARASTTFRSLPQVVKPGDTIFLNDGLVQLVVEAVSGDAVHCRVAVGGALLSHKGINVPDVELGISAFTERDRECLEFALTHGVDATGQSFVQSADDVRAVREAPPRHRTRRAGVRQNRARPRIAARRRDPGGGRRHHGRARRPRRRDPDRGHRDRPEGAAAQGQRGRQAVDHRDPDAVVDGRQPPADARRGDRRGERHPGRHRLRDALRGVSRGRVPGGRGAHVEPDRRGDRALHAAAPGAGAGVVVGPGRRDASADRGERRAHGAAGRAGRHPRAIPRRRDGTSHRALPPAPVDHRSEPVGGGLPGAAARVRGRSATPARAPRLPGTRSPAITSSTAPAARRGRAFCSPKTWTRPRALGSAGSSWSSSDLGLAP